MARRFRFGAVTGAILCCSSALAAAPTVTLSGYTDFQAGYSNDDSADALGIATDPVAFRNDNELVIRVDSGSESGLEYGAQIDLEADITDDVDGEGANASRSFTYLQGVWGRAELGGKESVAATMRVDASTIAVGSGGISGAWRHFADPTGTSAAPIFDMFITEPKLQMEHGSPQRMGDETTNNVTKISYYTPQWQGLQFGVSYAPDIDSRGQLSDRGLPDAYGEIWDVGVRYQHEFFGVNTQLSATAEGGDTGFASTDNISGWNAGMLLAYEGWSLAGSYGEWGEGAFLTTGAGSGVVIGALGTADGDYWTAGFGYQTGALGFSLTGITSRLDAGGGDAKFYNVVVGAEYRIAPGLTSYAEVSNYEFNPNAGPNNTGLAVIFGTGLAF